MAAATASAPNPMVDPGTTIVDSSSSNGGSGQTISYSAERIIGNGSFGVVFQAVSVQTGEVVAIKKVLQDKRFKNRELQIMRRLAKDTHPNIVHLRHCFYSNGERADEIYLNLVLEFVPETVFSVARQYNKSKQILPVLYVKMYMYQLCRALAHLHALGICHRDIKPQNLLVDPVAHVLKLCDFGSAKALVPGEPNVSYICSRYYRAPELIFGATDYTTAIDVWSSGCVFAELLLGQPLFPGQNGVDQLVEIIKVLGTPTMDQVRAMNSNYFEFKFPTIRPHPWINVFRSRTPKEAINLVAKMLAYIPVERILPLEGATHPFFEEIRDSSLSLPNNHPLPPLFNFTKLELSSNPALVQKLVPPHIDPASVLGKGTISSADGGGGVGGEVEEDLVAAAARAVAEGAQASANAAAAAASGGGGGGAGGASGGGGGKVGDGTVSPAPQVVPENIENANAAAAAAAAANAGK